MRKLCVPLEHVEANCIYWWPTTLDRWGRRQWKGVNGKEEHHL